MKKLILSVLLAFGVANASANIAIELANGVDTLNIDTATKTGVKAWMAAHPKTTTALVVALVSGTFVVTAYGLNKLATNGVLNVDTNVMGDATLGAWAQKPWSALTTAGSTVKTYGYETPKAWATNGCEYVKTSKIGTSVAAHPYIYGVSSTVVVATIAAVLYDMSSDTSKIKALINKLTSKKEPQQQGA